MKKVTINITDTQSEELERMSEETGVTKNGLICYAIWEWLRKNAHVTKDSDL